MKTLYFMNQNLVQIQKLKNYLEKLKEAKESHLLQDRITIYTRLIENKIPAPSERVKV